MQMRNDQDVEGDKDAPYAMPGGEEVNKSWCPLVQCPSGPQLTAIVGKAAP